MISIEQLAHQMKVEETIILEWIEKNNNSNDFYFIKIRNGKIKKRDQIVIGIGIFLNISRRQVERYLASYKHWKKIHKNNAQTI